MKLLEQIQQILTHALTSDDPSAVLAEIMSNTQGLNDDERKWLARLDEDGLHLTGLLIQKLRFERLTVGSAELEKLFATDPQRFMQLYRRYSREVPAHSYFPAEEARQFEQWRRTNSDRRTEQEI